MNTSLQIAVIGTGAVGGYYGSLLQQSGCETHFLLHNDFDYVHKNGLTIESRNGNFQLPDVNAYSNPADMPKCDIAFVALKTTSNHVLPDILPHVLKSNGIAITLQNGLGCEDEVADIIGSDRILGGLCFLCSNKVAPGHIRHLDYGLITLGEYRSDGLPGGYTPRLRRISELMKSADIQIKLVDDLLHARWKKLVWNIPFNGLSVVNNCLTDKLVKESASRDLCRILMQEVAAGSEACARPINPEFIEKMIMDTEKMKPYAPSMKLDYEKGKLMELNSIYGNPLQAAKSAGVEMPETEKLYQKLCAMDSSRP